MSWKTNLANSKHMEIVKIEVFKTFLQTESIIIITVDRKYIIIDYSSL